MREKAIDLLSKACQGRGIAGKMLLLKVFFKSLKTERVYKNEDLRRTDAEMSIIKWIETWYNRKRRHSALNYKTISEIELEIITNKQRDLT